MPRVLTAVSLDNRAEHFIDVVRHGIKRILNAGRKDDPGYSLVRMFLQEYSAVLQRLLWKWEDQSTLFPRTTNLMTFLARNGTKELSILVAISDVLLRGP